MCDFLSGFVHDEAPTRKIADRYLWGDLRSHSKTMELNGIRYGHPDCWREFEWLEESPDMLVVRTTDEKLTRRLRQQILRDFKTRSQMLSAVKIPDSVTTLDLRSATVSGDLKIPDSVTTLDLSSATVSGDLKIPDSVTTLDLRSATVSGDLKIPEGCRAIGRPNYIRREAEQFLLSAVTSLMRCSRVPYAAIGKINLMAKSLSDAAENKEGKS